MFIDRKKGLQMNVRFTSRTLIRLGLILGSVLLITASAGLLDAAQPASSNTSDLAIAAYQATTVPEVAPASETTTDTEAPVVEDIKYSDWFILKASAVADWDLIPGEDDLHFKLALKGSDPADSNAKKILLMFTKVSSSYDIAVDKILRIFQSKEIPAVFTAINFKKDNDLGQTALEFARGEKFDLIFSMGSDSTEFMYNNFRGESIPVVSVTSKNPVLLGYMKDYETGSGTNLAYTSLDVPIELQMIYLKQLMPNLKNIAVMYAQSNTSARQTQVEPLRNIAKDYNINIIDVVVVDSKQASAELQAAMPEAIAKIEVSDPGYKDSIFWITGSTEVFNEIETINQMAGKIPVLSVVPNVVQEGENSAVLSIGVTFESNAHLAAIYATDILLGNAQPGELNVGVVSPPDIAINFMKAREIGLKIPFSFFESASFVYDYAGKLVRKEGQVVS
jgi:putative tryptophan/tyrosine transport system substrate-binding protein